MMSERPPEPQSLTIQASQVSESETTGPAFSPTLQRLGKQLWKRCVVLLIVLTATTGLSFFARYHWIADLCANLRTQQLIAIVALLCVVAIARHWRWLGFLLVLLAVHLPWYRSAFLGGPHAGQLPQLRLMVMNVLTNNENYRAIQQQIDDAGPDAFAILELGSALERYLEQELEDSYPFRITIPQDHGNFGIGVYSRYPLGDLDRFALNVESIESISATISHGGLKYRFIAAHPLPPVGSNNFQARNAHLQGLTGRISEYRAEEPRIPIVLMGDLNLTPWSPLFSDLEESTQLRRAARGFGCEPTWYAKLEVFPLGLVLDHCLISDNLQCVTYSVGDSIGSDHRAVIAGLRLSEEARTTE